MMYHESMYRSDLEALILGVLKNEPAHGYEIAKQIRALSEGSLQVGEGLLYPALHRLEGDNLITSAWDSTAGGRAKRTYSITDTGVLALKEKRKAWSQFATGVSRILGAAEGGNP
jgi:DNA-binding PadR family transcriptional regulator